MAERGESVPWVFASPWRLLATLAVSLAVVVGTLAVLIVSRTRWSLVDQAVRQNTLVSRLVASSVAAQFDGLSIYVESFARRPLVVRAVGSRAVDTIRLHLKEMITRNRRLDRAFVTDPQGTLWADFPLAPEVAGQNFAYRDWYRGVSATQRTYVSEVYARNAAPKPFLVAIATPIRNEQNTTVGYLVAQQTLEALSSSIRAIEPSMASSVALVDHRGRLAMKQRGGDDAPLDVSRHRIVLDVLNGMPGSAVTDDPVTGEQSLISYAPVPAIGWGVLSRQPLTTVFGPAATLQRTIAGLALAAFAIMLGVGFIWLDTIRRQQHALRAAHAEVDTVNRQLEAAHMMAREQAERLLRHQTELNDMIASAQSALGEAVIVAERGERIIYVNDAYERIHGYSKDEILSLPSALVMVHPDEREKLAERVRRHAGGGLVPEHYETRIIHKSGRTVDIEVATQPVPRDGTFLVVAIVRDITERKQAEATLREREHRLRSIYNTVADVIFHLEVEPDGGYRFASVNPAFSSVTGVPEDAVIGKRVHEIIPEPSLSFVLDRYREAIQERKIVRWEETSDYPTGRLTGEVSVAPVFDASGTCTHLVGAVHDITERKRTEVEREQLLAREQEARAEVERLNAELEQRVANRTEQLEAANKELEAFSYSVAHDLRAPLRAIDGFSRLVVDGYGASLPDDARRYLDRVQQGARHMGELIDDLLTFSQLARQPLRRQQIDTRHLVEQVIAHLQPEHAAGTAAIRVAELPSVEADPALLRQVFANVLSNALKFTRSRAEPRIDVTHQADGGEVVFVVRDNGVGFDMRYVDKLFGVFQRLHRAEDYEGTGVGLAIVQRIIHRHGGRVWAEAEIDKGAAFYFTLGATDDGERSS